jgi:hypothetical protein
MESQNAAKVHPFSTREEKQARDTHSDGEAGLQVKDGSDGKDGAWTGGRRGRGGATRAPTPGDLLFLLKAYEEERRE